MSHDTLGRRVATSCEKHASNTAFVIDGRAMSFEELGLRAWATSVVLRETASPFVGIFAARSDAAVVGVIGSLFAGAGYLPLSSRLPTERITVMLELASCRIIVAGGEYVDELADLLIATESLTIVCPTPTTKLRELASRSGDHRFVFVTDTDTDTDTDTEAKTEVASVTDVSTPDAAAAEFAYLMFTSGTTGEPKGIAITHQNVLAYIDYTIARYAVGADDRLSQTFDLTFDLSVQDLFVGLLSGATVYVVPEAAVMAPAKFIREHELTLWFSVPSVAMFMGRMRMLSADVFPSLRYSLFCGEALPQRTVEQWQAAAPNSVVENLYGPTEATIAILNYVWDPVSSPAAVVNGVVPIGAPFAGQEVRIIDDRGKSVAVGMSGELCLAGSQVAPGYLSDPIRTAERFVILDDDPQRVWYRTGDVAREEPNGPIVYLGRTDDQIQLRGFRVELQQIDETIRFAAGTDLAIAVPTGLEQGRADAIVAVIEGDADPTLASSILAAARDGLPDYMVPSDVQFVEAIPLNPNGKIDRKASAALVTSDG